MPPPDPPLPIRPHHPRRPLLVALLIAAAFFAAVAPTLRWQDFSGGSENLVVETVLEMHRGGPWLIPTLQGVPRVTKPPLTAWITAAAVRQDTVARLSDRERAVRDAAFRELAWQVRWPSLLASCAMLVATYALARNLNLGAGTALASAAACGSTLLFLRFARGATTDVHLALWVTVANAFLALAFFRNRPWAGLLGAGAALGLAFMSKGPVAFVQTVLPFAAIGALRWTAGARPASDSSTPEISDRRSEISNSRPPPSPWLPALVGLALMLLIGLPWFGWVLYQHPDILRSWWTEVTREGATQLPPDPWYMYATVFLWVIPWLAWFAAGLWVGASDFVGALSKRQVAATPARDARVAPLLLFLLPVLVMSFFRDKPERYLLPMLPPAAVVAAAALVEWWRTDRRDVGGRVVDAAHWLTLAVMAVGVPVAGLLAPRFNLGEPWFRPAGAAALGVPAVALLGLGYAFRGRADVGAATTVLNTCALILLLQFPVMRAYGRMSVADLKPLADVVWADYPDAQVYQYEPGGRTRVRMDLAIYLGRTTRAIGREDLPKNQTDRPQVVVFLERYADKAPPLQPPWKELASGGGRKGGWRAFVLPASGG